MRDQTELEQIIGYTFKNKHFLTVALTHSSYANESKNKGNILKDNERIEFLGDAVLELTSSTFLFHHYKELPEGKLTKLRASLVCEQALAMCAKEIDLGSFILLGKGEEMTGGRQRPSVTSDAFESLIGAIYLDGGFEQANNFVIRFVLNDIEHKKLFSDCKTRLQEIVQKYYPKEQLHYELIKEDGPDHLKQFEIVAMVGEKVVGHGISHTKKDAEQQAAFEAVTKMKKD